MLSRDVEARRRLAAAVARRDAARDKLDAAEANLKHEAAQALAAGVPAPEVAKAAGVTRQTVYNWQREVRRASRL